MNDTSNSNRIKKLAEFFFWQERDYDALETLAPAIGADASARCVNFARLKRAQNKEKAANEKIAALKRKFAELPPPLPVKEMSEEAKAAEKLRIQEQMCREEKTQKVIKAVRDRIIDGSDEEKRRGKISELRLVHG